MLPETFRCYLIEKTGKDQIESVVETRPTRELPAGDVLIEVKYSAVNYKDALACQGHPGVVRKFPHVPGVDAAGTVVQSSVAEFQVGDHVLVTSYELGVERWGGWAQYVCVPADWVIPLPGGLSLPDSMTLGTAGLTAGLCIRALQQHGIDADAGDLLVTGATGGVGSLAIKLLAKLGYNVVAVSGKRERSKWLQELGASRVIEREAVLDESRRPLLKTRWAGAVDTAGGAMLASILKSIKKEGCVAVCGVVGGANVNTSVYPFILRGVTLQGIDSAWCPMPRRREIWDLLAGAWRPDSLDSVKTTIGLSELPGKVEQMLAGHSIGRTIIDLGR